MHPPASALSRPGVTPHCCRRSPAEHEARAIRESYGIAGPQERFGATAEEAARAAATIGFPVVLKGIVADMIHKSDAGLVKLRLGSADEVRDAAEKMFSLVKNKV